MNNLMYVEDIYISKYLKKTDYGLPVYNQLKDKLEKLGFNIHEIKNNSDNEWCRDYISPFAGSEPRNDTGLQLMVHATQVLLESNPGAFHSIVQLLLLFLNDRRKLFFQLRNVA